MSHYSVTTRRTDHRGACDKCHKLKVRCERPTDNSKCHRCLRLKSSCSYSPSLPLGRPRKDPSRGSSRNSLRRRKASTLPDPRNKSHNDPLPPVESSTDLATPCASEQEFGLSPFWGPLTGSVEWLQQLSSCTDVNLVENRLFGLQTPPISEPDFGNFDIDCVRDEGWWSSLLDPADSSTVESPLSSDTNLDDMIPDGEGCSIMGMRPSAESDEQINTLFDIQLKLAKMHMFWAGSTQSSSGVEEYRTIEDIYDISQHLAEVARRFYGTERPSPVVSTISTTRGKNSLEIGLRGGEGPHISTFLLLLSCYTRLLDIYTLLVQFLQETLNNSSSTASDPSSESNEVPQTSRSSCARVRFRVPASRLIHSRLPMPPSANLGMHLIVICSMIKLLKETMSSCATQNVASNKIGICSSTVSSHTPELVAIELTMSGLVSQEERLAMALDAAKGIATL